MAAPIRLGIVGFGIMGERLLRAAREHAADHVAVSGVWDPAPDAASRLGDAAPFLASADAVIAACDCLYIAAPPAAHLPLADAALASGRAVFLEKPLATDLDAARAFVARAEAQGARAAVNFPMASSPAVAQLAAWQAQLTPRSLAIEVGFAAWPRGWQRAAASWLAKRAEGGFTREVVSHFLFLARRRLGPLVLTDAAVDWPKGDGSETAIRVKMSAGGVPVTLRGAVGMTIAEDQNSWTLNDEIRLRDWSFAERRGPQGEWLMQPDALPNEKLRPMVLRGQLAGVAAMTRGEPHQLATLREALDVQEVVERILEV